MVKQRDLTALARALRSTDQPVLLLEDNADPAGGRALLFTQPDELLVCRDPARLPEALMQIDQARSRGLWVAGFLSYEVGYLLEDKLKPLYREPGSLPLLWLGLYKAPQVIAGADLDGCFRNMDLSQGWRISDHGLSMSRSDYLAAVARIKDFIAAGDVYQINYTLKQLFAWSGDPLALYGALRDRQKVAHGGYLQTPEFAILSRSPELFVEVEKRWATCRPMKGTAPRGRTNEEDRAIADWLRNDEKSRAENLMIVDLLRNDLSRVAEIGSVSVDPLFAVERYSTLQQMTSTIHGRLKAGTGARDLLRKLFPCGSITGAPKVRAMEIIHELEPDARGCYTGSLGCFNPNGDLRLNVAIRTLVLLSDGRGELGIGSGIVFDSDPESEFDECRLKARFLEQRKRDFQLIETLRFDGERGFHYLAEHLDRLEDSAAYFGFPCSRDDVRDRLAGFSAGLTDVPSRVRLLLDSEGRLELSASPLEDTAFPAPLRIRMAQTPVDSANPFLFHKTTIRDFYDESLALAEDPSGCHDLLYVNENGEVTEASRFNLFLRLDGLMVTPPLMSGLLPGTLRRALLDRGDAVERVVTPDDLRRAEGIFLGNSVRGLIEARLLPNTGVTKDS